MHIMVSNTSSAPSSLYGKRLLRAASALFFMSSILLPAAAQYPSSDTACTRQYTVQRGDTCDKIGQKTLTSTYQIMALNLPQSGPDCYNLQIGAKLCLGRFGNDCQMVHRATGSDSCESIAAHYGVSVATLQENNPTLDCDVVYDGLMLCTLDGLVRPPADPQMHLVAKAPVANNVQMPMGKVVTAVVPPNATDAKQATSDVKSKLDQKTTKAHVQHFKHGTRQHRNHH